MTFVDFSDQGQYFIAVLKEGWGDEHLRELVYASRGLQKTEHLNKLLIQAPGWLEHSFKMETILAVADMLSRLGDASWKIAVNTTEHNGQNEALENMLMLKGVELCHFTDQQQAVNWLLK